MRSGKHSATFFTVTDAKLYPEVYTDDLFLPLRRIWPSSILVVFSFTKKKKKKKSYWALPCCDNVKMRMGTLNCVQLTEKQSQGALWQDFPWCLKWFHLRFYYPRTGLMCPSIYLVNAQVNKIENKTQEQTLLSLHCFSADFEQKTGLDQQLLEEGLKTSIEKWKSFCFLVYRTSEENEYELREGL